MPLTPRVPHGMLSSVRFSTGFFLTRATDFAKKAGTVRCLLGNIFRLGNSHGPEDFFLGGGGEKISWISGGTCEDK